MDRDSSVGIATRCGMDGPGIESRWGTRFSVPVQTGPGAHPGSYTMGTGSFPGVKRPGRGADHPPPSKGQGHERAGLYLYSPSGPQWSVMEWNFMSVRSMLRERRPIYMYKINSWYRSKFYACGVWGGCHLYAKCTMQRTGRNLVVPLPASFLLTQTFRLQPTLRISSLKEKS